MKVKGDMGRVELRITLCGMMNVVYICIYTHTHTYILLLRFLTLQLLELLCRSDATFHFSLLQVSIPHITVHVPSVISAPSWYTRLLLRTVDHQSSDLPNPH